MEYPSVASIGEENDLVSEHVGAMAWNNAKPNVPGGNCVGSTMPHGSCCKGNARPMPDLVLLPGDGDSANSLGPS